MCKVITITNQKGGTGKTTTSLFLAYGLAERGKHVLVVDLDQQADTTFSLTHGKDYSASGKTTYEMLTQQKQAQDCIVQINLLLDLIPASSQLAALDIALIKNNMYRADLLKDAIDPIKSNYDFILIDTPPALSVVVTNALTVSDRVLIPVQADLFSIKGLADLAKTLQKVPNPNLDVMGILITRFNPRTVYSKAVATELNKAAEAMNTRVFHTRIKEAVATELNKAAEAMNTRVFHTRIKEAVAIKEALHQFKSLDDYDKRSNAAKNVNQFIDEFLKVNENDKED